MPNISSIYIKHVWETQMCIIQFVYLKIILTPRPVLRVGFVINTAWFSCPWLACRLFEWFHQNQLENRSMIKYYFKHDSSRIFEEVDFFFFAIFTTFLFLERFYYTFSTSHSSYYAWKDINYTNINKQDI